MSQMYYVIGIVVWLLGSGILIACAIRSGEEGGPVIPIVFLAALSIFLIPIWPAILLMGLGVYTGYRLTQEKP